jgi:hypothetical protein
MILLANVVIMQNLFQQNRTYKYCALDFNVSVESSIMADEERWWIFGVGDRLMQVTKPRRHMNHFWQKVHE